MAVSEPRPVLNYATAERRVWWTPQAFLFVSGAICFIGGWIGIVATIVSPTSDYETNLVLSVAFAAFGAFEWTWGKRTTEMMDT